MMNLTTISLPKLYKFHWIFKVENMVVKQQVKVKVSIRYYEQNVLCGQVPMEACDILLERPQQINPKTIREGHTNKIICSHKNKIVLSSFSFSQVVKNQENKTRKQKKRKRKLSLEEPCS